MSKLVIVIPTYNELGNVQPLLRAFDEVLHTLPRNWQLQLLFVDDNSPDGTAKLIQTAIAKRQNRQRGLRGKQIILYQNEEKRGLGKAYLVGMEYAYAQLNADAIGQFDADLSHDPTKIPLMLCEINAGVGMVIGSRYVAGGSIPANWGWHRKLLSSLGNTLVRFGLGHPEVSDWSTGFRILTRQVYQKIRKVISEEQFFGYLIMIGIVHAGIKAKCRIKEVPFAFVDRTYGESKLGVEYILHTLGYVGKQRAKHQWQTFRQFLDWGKDASYNIDKKDLY